LVRIRLRRMGLRSRPSYRVVATDSRQARDSKYLESVGSYDPRSKQLNLNLERVNYWLGRGAQASDTVSRLMKRFARQQAPAPVDVAAAPVEAAAAPTPEPEMASAPAAEPAPAPPAETTN